MGDYEHKDNISSTAIVAALDMIVKKLDGIEKSLHEKGGIQDRISVVETKGESTQKELTEHKTNHWQYVGAFIGVSGVVVGLAVAIIELVKK